MDNPNSICFVASISSIQPIPDADNIELVVAGGWNAIAKRGQYTQGDLVVVAATDAVIPVTLSDALGVTGYLRKGQRVRTVKLRGVYSECLLIPTSFIPGIGDAYLEGECMQDRMGITKWEPPAVQIQLSSGRKVKYHQNPNFRVYHKFPNLKNVAGLFTEEDNVQITRKIHGTNARYGIVKKRSLSLWDRFKKLIRIADEWIDYEYVYGSHNVEKGSDSQGFYDTDVWRTVAEKYAIKEKLWRFVRSHPHPPRNIGEGIVLYGEIYGPGIQRGYDYGVPDLCFAAFDVTVDGEYQNVFRVKGFVNEWAMDLPHVPVLYTGPWSQEIQDQFTFNNWIDAGKTPHEGIVIKHVSGTRSKVAKVINPDYHVFNERNQIDETTEYNH